MLEKDFKEIIVSIKKEINQTQVLIMSDANIRLLSLYFKIGKMIYENSKWGDKFIESLEREIKLDFPNIKGFSARNLGRMKKFYTEYMKDEILPPAVAKLPWTHNNIQIDKVKDKAERIWCASEAVNNNWSKIVLEHQIDLKPYERQATVDKTNNFKNMVIVPTALAQLLCDL